MRAAGALAAALLLSILAIGACQDGGKVAAPKREDFLVLNKAKSPPQPYYFQFDFLFDTLLPCSSLMTSGAAKLILRESCRKKVQDLSGDTSRFAVVAQLKCTNPPSGTLRLGRVIVKTAKTDLGTAAWVLALLKYSGTQEIIQSVRTQLTVLGLGTWAPHALVYRNSYYESTCVKTKKVATEVQGTVCPPNVKWDPAALVQLEQCSGSCGACTCPAGQSCDPVNKVCRSASIPPCGPTCSDACFCPTNFNCDPATKTCKIRTCSGTCDSTCACPSGKTCDAASKTCKIPAPTCKSSCSASCSCPSGQVCDTVSRTCKAPEVVCSVGGVCSGTGKECTCMPPLKCDDAGDKTCKLPTCKLGGVCGKLGILAQCTCPEDYWCDIYNDGVCKLGVCGDKGICGGDKAVCTCVDPYICDPADNKCKRSCIQGLRCSGADSQCACSSPNVCDVAGDNTCKPLCKFGSYIGNTCGGPSADCTCPSPNICDLSGDRQCKPKCTVNQTCSGANAACTCTGDNMACDFNGDMKCKPKCTRPTDVCTGDNACSCATDQPCDLNGTKLCRPKCKLGDNWLGDNCSTKLPACFVPSQPKCKAGDNCSSCTCGDGNTCDPVDNMCKSKCTLNQACGVPGSTCLCPAPNVCEGGACKLRQCNVGDSCSSSSPLCRCLAPNFCEGTCMNDRDILLKWKASFGASSQTPLSTWQSNSFPCDTVDGSGNSNWAGVRCSGAGGRVTELNLPGLGLSGSISGTSLPSTLTVLNLKGNDIKGPLSFSPPSRLVTLDMSENPNLTGSIPPSFGSLPALNTLNLAKCALTGSVVNLASNIKYLRLNNNLFTSISASRLPSALKELDISNNQISSYLSAATALTNLPSTLTSCQVQNNKLRGPFPYNFNFPTSLSLLDFSNNQLVGSLPGNLRLQATSLTVHLDGNQLSGPLPKIATLAGAAQVPTIYIKPGNSGLCGQQLPDTVISPPNYYDEGTGAPAATDACSGINLGACSTARPWLSCTSTCTCTEASKPRCDAATGVCRECQVSSDCQPGSKPICYNASYCKGCASSQECNFNPARSKCLGNGVCAPCIVDLDCTLSTKPKCDAGTCRACASNADCPIPNKPICMGTGECRGCTASSDCAFDPKNSRCDTGLGDCLPCVANADCTDLTKTKCTAGVCQPCEGDADCPAANPKCNVGTGTCGPAS